VIIIKIGIVSPLNFATTSKSTGSVESLNSSLVKSLVKHRDIEITLFASGDSDKEANLIPIIDKGFKRYCHKDIDNATKKQVEIVKSMAHEFDIIHSHLPVGDTEKIMGGHNTPVIKTVHGAIIKQCNKDATIKRISSASKISFLTPVSEYLNKEVPSLRYTDTVYNGIDMKKFKFNSEPKGDEKGDYWAFMGRINKEKGVHYAIKTALYHGKRLKIAGMVSSDSGARYFDEYIKPHLGKQIEYVGVVKEDKVNFLGNAKLTIVPSCCQEAFGLVNVESLACGTPVLASKRGAFPEIISSGHNGYLARGQDFTIALEELFEFAPLAEKIDRKTCRDSILEKFTFEKMAENYIKVYKKVLNKAY
jgi:glycosyltransferase involved in cell wall biosynthesis